MPVGEKSRPPSLQLSKDKTKSDMIMRIVSPITPQFVNPDMRDTLKISEVIRLQQNELIAAGKYRGHEKKRDVPIPHRLTPVSSNWADDVPMDTATSSANLHTGGSSETISNEEISGSVNDTESGDDDRMDDETDETNDKKDNDVDDRGEGDNGDDGDDVDIDNYTVESNECSIVEMECDGESPNEVLVPVTSLSDSENVSPTDDIGISRIGQGFSPKALKRNNAPGPLRISAKSFTTNTAPMINSAPMRSLYAAPLPIRRYPVRYVYPQMSQMGQIPHMAHFPQTAVHYMATPIIRGVPVGAERVTKPRSPRLHSARRRKPVVDVFEGSSAKLAPMPSQPPSAQKEKFNISHSDDEKATQEEMEEMELKRKKAAPAMRGSISFNEESAFNFTLFQGNESSAKKKFIEICETTWDKYMATQAGS